MVIASYDGGWALRAGIAITINLPGNPTSVTQHYFNQNNCTILLGMLSTHLHPFKVIEDDFYI